jgi:hypothetical protein
VIQPCAQGQVNQGAGSDKMQRQGVLSLCSAPPSCTALAPNYTSKMQALAARSAAPLRQAVRAPLRQQTRKFGGGGDVSDVRLPSFCFAAVLLCPGAVGMAGPGTPARGRGSGG